MHEAGGQNVQEKVPDRKHSDHVIKTENGEMKIVADEGNLQKI